MPAGQRRPGAALALRPAAGTDCERAEWPGDSMFFWNPVRFPGTWSMNILVTSSRMPFALDEIRKFGKRRHRVFATDTFSTSPGSHSRYVTRAVTTAAPRQEPLRFIRQIEELVEEEGIELIVPAFEEVFYLRQGSHLL